MDPISNNLPAGMTSTQMSPKGKPPMPKLEEGETFSKDALTEALSSQGVDEAKIDKIFGKMDTDGNGEVSYEEQQAMRESMKSRRGEGNGPRFSEENADANSIKSVMESLVNTDIDDDIKNQLNSALEKMESDGYSQKSISKSISLLNNLLPTVDVTT